MRGKQINGPNLRQLREQAGLRVKDMATIVGCVPGYVTNIESGVNEPGAATAWGFARALTERLGRDVLIDEFMDPKADNSDEAAA